MLDNTNTDFTRLAENIKSWGKKLGFQGIRITHPSNSEAFKHLERWLKKEHNGEMRYMQRNLDIRKDPSKLIGTSARIICVRLDYLPSLNQSKATLKSRNKGYVSQYALGRDYHKVIRNKLKRLGQQIEQATPHQFRAFTDSAPILERALAEQAGLGWIGKNTLLLNRKAGSFFFLGEIITNLPLPIDQPTTKNHCGSCQACIDICPTKAIIAPYQLDARRCISYLNIEFKGSIPLELRPLMGNRIVGCDDCQLICPWNKFAKVTTESDFKPRHALDKSALVDLFLWSEAEFLRKTEGSAIRRIGYSCWIRNTAVALGNAPYEKKIKTALESRKDFPNPMVREHIQWAIDQQEKKRNEIK